MSSEEARMAAAVDLAVHGELLDQVITAYRLRIAALYPTHDGERSCCRARGDRQLSAEHEDAHRYAEDWVTVTTPGLQEAHRRHLVQQLAVIVEGRRRAE